MTDGNAMVSPASFCARSLLVHTYSKSILAPRQRLGSWRSGQLL